MVEINENIVLWNIWGLYIHSNHKVEISQTTPPFLVRQPSDKGGLSEFSPTTPPTTLRQGGLSDRQGGLSEGLSDIPGGVIPKNQFSPKPLRVSKFENF